MKDNASQGRADPTPFHMVQLWLDVRRLYELGRMLDLFRARRPVSLSYLVHCALGELFQAQAPRPFAVEGENRRGPWVRVLGYADVPWETLQELARGFASPAVYAICGWDRGASKPMPTEIPRGMRLAFSVRVCPVVRKASAGQSPRGRRWQKGQELDVFLDAAWSQPEAVLDREAVYAEWLRRQLARPEKGGARVETVRMTRFSIERMTRRTNGSSRSVTVIQRPDVTLEGVLTVTDSAAFMRMLRRGVGRHTSFGYGMLKLRRA